MATNNDKHEIDMFDTIFKQNERRIHYHIHKLHIQDPHNEFYQEGLYALWKAYETYEPTKGPMATYFNYTIRNQLIDMIRKRNREGENQEKIVLEHKTQTTDGNHIRKEGSAVDLQHMSDILLDDTELWQNLQHYLTDKEWNWIYFYIIGNMSVKDIAIQENTTENAVKSWGKQVRKKLRDPAFREKIAWDISL
ncbi:sigma-70 family RNA polymerase sigma factor [Oceanobacillus halotolerans]|uniref:sigma-70 family RNA polymerase sigma factor n=1 Tax=Oceanobacillus halotolerans TaxID=2663380 RepID=UPI001CF767D0|nr:sigma-70 family RNA polymerase sigma factor [Oceanobacillus halotolerans]